MAQKFGGKYSPGGPKGDAQAAQADPFRGRPAAKVSILARLMYVWPLPLLLTGIGAMGRPVEMIRELGAFAVLILAAWLLNEGIRAKNEYDARKIARPPAIPRKMFAAILVGAAVTVAAYSGLTALSPISAGLVGIVASAAHLIAFGFDPVKKKGMTGHDDFASERAASAIDKAEVTVRETLDAARRIGDRQLEGRVERLMASAREVFARVEEDPRDLPRARKFMTVYLAGARDATAKFADVYSRSKDADARAKYESLLSDLETNFADKREQLLLDDRTDLDVEIEVLQERLQREGVRSR